MKIAVVGAGISGLGSALILAQEHEVELFEARSTVGGHAQTVHVKEGALTLPMDVGFLVYNELTYPHLCALFRYLKVETVASDMSLSVRTLRSGLEWSGTNLNSVFGQRKNLLRPKFYKLLFEILRFHREAEENFTRSKQKGWTLGQLLNERKFSETLCDDYVLPMGAAIWSTPEEAMLEYPAATFLSFFLNHKLLQVNNRPIWRTVKNGSENYVKRIKSQLANVHESCSVKTVRVAQDGVWVAFEGGEKRFDKVVMATHAPTTLSLLKNPSPRVREVLSAFKVQANSSALHRDPAAMPKQKRCWSSWNAFAEKSDRASLTYHLNRLQPLATKQDYFLTLNPIMNYASVIQKFTYDHPRFDWSAIRAQEALPTIQGADGIYFAGAWTRYGFHEDGLLSAVKVGECFGLKPPWAGA